MQGDSISLAQGEGKFRVQCDAVEIGSDLVVKVYGGDKPHVGAVAIGIPRPSLADGEQISASVSVFTLTGHKEDELAKILAGKIAAALNRVTVLTAGIHIDNITPEEIRVFEKNAVSAVEGLINNLLQKDL